MDVKVGEFEGPFELLFHLIEKNKIDITDIPIVLLTNQYMDYMKKMPQKDMESMSEFILMAATLLEIKSKMLLPVKEKEEEEVIDPRQELVNKLIEYKRAKLLAKLLEEQMRENLITKKPETSIINLCSKQVEIPMEEILGDISLEKLFLTFEEVILRKKLKVDKVRAGFNSVKKDEFTIESKTIFILNLLALNSAIVFNEIFTVEASKSELITTFLAMLELIKVKKIKITQENNFDDILIEVA